MGDAGTFWLIAANALLGLGVLISVATLITAIVRDVKRRHAISRELDRDMRRMFGRAKRPP